MRAQRLGAGRCLCGSAAETNLRDILTTLEEENPISSSPDSIPDECGGDNVDSAPGSVSQVRAAAHELNKALPNGSGVSVIPLWGHAPKTVRSPAPRWSNIMVDTVLYFEGERGTSSESCARQNRFGPAGMKNRRVSK